MPPIWQETHGRNQLIGIKGRLDHDLTAPLDYLLRTLMEQGQSQLVVDLTAVTYINSGGLRVLVSARRRAQEIGGSLTLLGLSPRLLEIFQMVGFDTLFPIYPTRQAWEAQQDRDER
ncbi:MAG: STAS domain-containing protein [Chloroflexi bacterium]|nr:STAS domain-containing protein [Chloroflexota bacterium]